MFLTSMTSIFQESYHENTDIVGLNFLPLDIGHILEAQVNAQAMDRIYIYLKNHGVGEPEFRLREIPGTIILPAGLFMAG